MYGGNKMSEPFETRKLDEDEIKDESTFEDQVNTAWEEIKVTGSEVVDKVKELLHEGNIRRIVIKQEDRTVIEVPLTWAAVGVLIAPVLAALGAFAALVTDCSIVVEREI